MVRFFSSAFRGVPSGWLSAVGFLSLLLAASALITSGCWSEVQYEPPKEPAAKETPTAEPPAAEAPESSPDSDTTTQEPAQPATAASTRPTADELFGSDEPSSDTAPPAEPPPVAEATPPSAEQSAVKTEKPRALFPWEEDALTPPATEASGTKDAATPPAEQPATEPGDTPRDPLPWEQESPAVTPHVGDRYATSPPPSEPPADALPLTDDAGAAAPVTDSEPPAEEKPFAQSPLEPSTITEPTQPQPTEPVADATPDALPVEEPVTTAPPSMESPPAEVTPLLPDEETAEAASPAAIDPTNTRHNAWMLGSKWSLMIFSEHAGAPANVQSQRLEESQALAVALGVELPKTSPYPASQPTAAFLEIALPSGRELGVSIGKKHGAEETALMEVAIKSNLLLVLAEARPDLIPAVIRSVTAAAERAQLPAVLIEPFAKALAGSPTAEQVDQAVFEFHRAVDEHLRAQ